MSPDMIQGLDRQKEEWWTMRAHEKEGDQEVPLLSLEVTGNKYPLE